MNENNYVVTDDVDKATHWLATEDEDHDKWSEVTIGRFYELVWDKKYGEHHIIDDNGIRSFVFLVHEGDFIFYK